MQNYLKHFGSLAVLFVAAILYDRFKLHELNNTNNQNYHLIHKYLLNNTSNTNNNLPMLWIHVDYEYNSRMWSSFGSRSSDNLNQPYLFLTIKSIINQCGKDFNICLINDNSFEQILPNWTIDFSRLSSPVKDKVRNLALTRTLYYYGGITIPASFLCMKPLGQVYNQMTAGDKIVVGELVDHNSTSTWTHFFPSHKIIGCRRGCKTMKELCSIMERIISDDYTDESTFLGLEDQHLLSFLFANKANQIDAKLLGVEDIYGKIVGIDRLIGNSHIPFDTNLYGIYIPNDEILKRTAYQWFARLSTSQVMSSKTNIGELLRSSNVTAV